MKNTSKKILAIFPQLPLPEFSGDRQKVNNLIKVLSQHYSVHAVIICRESPTASDEQFLSTYCEEYRIFKLSKIKMFVNLLRGLIYNESLQVNFFYHSEAKRYIDKNTAGKYFLFCNLIRVSKYCDSYEGNKFIDIVDSISINYKRSLDKVTSPFWKMIYRYEYKRLRVYEKEVINRFNASFLVNYPEQQHWLSETKKQVVWLPNGIKEQLFQYEQSNANIVPPGSIVFIGKMDYQPNLDAVIWFLKNVWSLVDPSVHFYIIGPRPPERLLKLVEKQERVLLKGYIEDPYSLMSACAAVVSPMQTGGGVQNKILEGMALGKVNITTTLGAESIHFAEDKEHLLIADTPELMADLINKVCRNPSLYDTIGTNAREMVKRVYTWENFGNTMIEAIENEMNKK